MNNLKLIRKEDIDLGVKLKCVAPNNGMNEGFLCASEFGVMSSNSLGINSFVDSPIEVKTMLNGNYLYLCDDKSIYQFDNYDGTEINSYELPSDILSISLCPDDTILLVLEENGNIIVLTNELMYINEFNLEQNSFGMAQHNSVGWGKKETQFVGKGRKDEREIVTSATVRSYLDLGNFSFAWKEDNEYFAISWLCNTELQTNVKLGARLIRVFTRDGKLFSTSEAINTLENGLCWRSKANLIATSCRSNQGLEIVFIEQNGLRHGGFLLYDKDECKDKYVTELKFNSNDNICAISIRTDQSNEWKINLYTTKNYHWYIKQSLSFNESSIIDYFWINQSLNVFQLNGQQSTYHFDIRVDRCMLQYSSNHTFKHPRMVAVIDNNKLLITPFEFNVVPPPYSSYNLEFDKSLAYVFLPSFSAHNSQVPVLVQFEDKSAVFMILENKSDKVITSKCSLVNKFGRQVHQYKPITELYTQLNGYVNDAVWINPSTVYAIIECKLVRITITNSTELNIESVDTNEVEPCVLAYKDVLFYEDFAGQVYTLDSENAIKKFCSLPRFCSEFSVIKLGANSHIMALDSHGKNMYLDNEMLSGHYLSILCSSNYLFITTINQKLVCINLENITQTSKISDMLNEKNINSEFNEISRLLEPGTELISSVECDSKIIVAMPRGNLETIYPRTLVLDKCCQLINQLKYTACIKFMRQHRINMNLVYDYNPTQFMINLPRIIQENLNNDYLMIMTSELSDCDITKTFYKDYFNKKSVNNQSTDFNNKINRITQEIIDIVHMTQQTEAYLELVLSCHVKQVPCTNDKALQLLCQFKTIENKVHLWDKGLKFLQYLISIDDLYRVALSTYDLKLALEVAQKTNMDPKEYVDLLNELKEIECDNYRCYKINVYVKNNLKALEFLSTNAKEHWDEYLELVNTHKLYKSALNMLEHGKEEYNKISELYCDYLLNTQKDIRLAGLVLMRTNNAELCDKACEMFMRHCSWREWITASKFTDMTEEQVKIGLVKLAQKLFELSRYEESVLVYEKHLRDNKNAFEMALKGCLFIEAMRLKVQLNQIEVDEKFERGVLKISKDSLLKIEELKINYQTSYERLMKVRQEMIVSFEESKMKNDDHCLPDYMSDTLSTVSSLNSEFSTMSKKIRHKKANKKQWSDKPGSQKEEIGLLEKLYNNVTETQSLFDYLKELLDVLLVLRKPELSNNIVDSFNALLLLQKPTLIKVWDKFLLNNPEDPIDDYEVQISNHIKVSKGPTYFGRRRYLLKEQFLMNMPTMKWESILSFI